MNAKLKWVLLVTGGLLMLLTAYYLYVSFVTNARVAEELTSNPGGERAARVMLLTLPSGKQIPVNYLREQNTVFVGADGPWWRQLDGASVTMVIRGEKLAGRAVTILDNPGYTADVFSRLRPTAPGWLPDWLNGKLVEITLSQADS